MDRSEAREAVLQVAIERLEGASDDDWLDEFDSEDWPVLTLAMERLIERLQEMAEDE